MKSGWDDDKALKALSPELEDRLYQKLFDMGIDVICCNEPHKAKEFRDNVYNKNNHNLLLRFLIAWPYSKPNCIHNPRIF